MRILYIYTGGRKIRLKPITENAPKEFFLGYDWLKRMYNVDILEINDLKKKRAPYAVTLLEKILMKFTPFSSFATKLASKRSYLKNFDLIIASNEYVAFSVFILKFCFLLKTPYVFFVMGMLAKLEKQFDNKLARMFYKFLLSRARAAIFLGEGEFSFANSFFNDMKHKNYFLPFSVDTSFWKNSLVSKSMNYILFIGNDKNRDYNMLIKIAQANPSFRFVAISKKIKAKGNPPNLEIINGDWKDELLSDQQIREYIIGSKFVILPLKETIQPSGQSVAMQAMACKRAVLISYTKGFWHSEHFRDKWNIRFVMHPRVQDWSYLIKDIWQNEQLREQIEQNAFWTIEKYYSIANFGRQLNKIIHKIL